MKKFSFLYVIISMLFIVHGVGFAKDLDITTVIGSALNSGKIEHIEMQKTALETEKIRERLQKRLEWPTLEFKYAIDQGFSVNSNMRIDGGKFFRGDYAEINRQIAENNVQDSIESSIYNLINQYFVGVYYEKVILMLSEAKNYSKNPYFLEELSMQIENYHGNMFLLQEDLKRFLKWPTDERVRFTDELLERSEFDNLELATFRSNYLNRIEVLPEIKIRKLQWERAEIEEKEEFWNKFPAITFHATQNLGDSNEFSLQADLDFSYFLDDLLKFRVNANSDLRSKPNGSISLQLLPETYPHSHFTGSQSFHDYEQRLQEQFLELRYSYRALQLSKRKYHDFMQNAWVDEKHQSEMISDKLRYEMSVYTAQLNYSQNVVKLYDGLGILYEKWESDGVLTWLYRE